MPAAPAGCLPGIQLPPGGTRLAVGELGFLAPAQADPALPDRPATATVSSAAANDVTRRAWLRPGRPASWPPAPAARGTAPARLGSGQRLGLQQVSDRAAERGAHLVQVIQADRDRLAAPQRSDLAQRRGEPGLLEGLQQVAGPPDVTLGRCPPQVPLHRRFPLSIVSRCTARPAAARLAFSGSAWAWPGTKPWSSDGHGRGSSAPPTATSRAHSCASRSMPEQVGMKMGDRPGQEPLPGDLQRPPERRRRHRDPRRPPRSTPRQPRDRSDGNSGAPGSSGSSQNPPRHSSTHHHSNSRPSANMYACRGRGPEPRAPLPFTRNRPHCPTPSAGRHPHPAQFGGPDRGDVGDFGHHVVAAGDQRLAGLGSEPRHRAKNSRVARCDGGIRSPKSPRCRGRLNGSTGDSTATPYRRRSRRRTAAPGRRSTCR